MATFTFEVFDECGDEVQFNVPGKYEVCPRCDGVGKHDHPAFSNGFTREDMDDDPDFAEEYKSGRYDVECSKCHGKRVVCVPDVKAMTPKQKFALVEYRKTQREMAADDRSERHLRMLESGGY